MPEKLINFLPGSKNVDKNTKNVPKKKKSIKPL